MVLIVRSSLYGSDTNPWKQRRRIFTPILNSRNRLWQKRNHSKDGCAAIVQQINFWPSSRAFDNAESRRRKRGDSLDFQEIAPLNSALSVTRQNGPYAELG